MVGALALSGCYEHRTLDFPMPEPDGSTRPPSDGGVRDDPDFGLHGPDLGFGGCGGRTSVHRFDELRIPTPSEASSGGTVGHDIDGRSVACGVPDYPGDVDNALIDFAAAIPALSPDNPILLQMALDRALRCAPGSASCSPLPLDLQLNRNATGGCAQVVFTDGMGSVVSSVGAGAVGANGGLRVELDSLQLTIPYPTANGDVDIPLRLSDVIVTASVSDAGLEDIVIGGSLQKGEFEATVRALLPLLSDDVQFDDVAAILQALYDVEVAGGCAGLSVGLLGGAR